MVANNKKKKKKKINPYGCALWIVLGLGGMIWFFSGSDEPREKKPENQGVGATTLCKRAVEQKLVSPASAKHPWVLSKDVTHDLGNNRYRVLSYVDSQNKFGAMLRTQYDCVVERVGENLVLISLETE